MFNRFTKDARAIVRDAVEIAHELGASSVEAEHLLLAAARQDDAPSSCAFSTASRTIARASLVKRLNTVIVS